MKAMAAQAFQQTDEVRIEQIALDDAGGDAQKAVELLTERILQQPEIVQAHLSEWARAWASAKVHSLIAGNRVRILEAVGGANSGQFAAHLATAIKNEADRLMDLPIWGGKRLADATADEVRESARRYQALATDNARKARFYELVAEAAEKKGGGVIAKLLDEKGLTRLWEKADV